MRANEERERERERERKERERERESNVLREKDVDLLELKAISRYKNYFYLGSV